MIFIFLVLFLMSYPGLHGGWLDRKAEGWFWYEDKNKDKDAEPELLENSAIIPSQPSPSIYPATEEMNLIRKELEEKLHRAVLEPTEENVMIYMRMQQQWIDQSSKFSDSWVRNLLHHPDLDQRIKTPITQYGVQVQKQILRENKEEKIRMLAQSYGLFFFYEGNNKISQAFSFVVKEFVKKYQWEVFSISCDKFLLPGFEYNQMDQGITQRLGVTQFPSLYLVEPKQQKVFPIAFGLSSIDQIEDNIHVQFEMQEKNSL
jgi:conjugal transfer pilus assembly protein TraF